MTPTQQPKEVINPQTQIQIKANDQILSGEYANMMRVSHSSEEFVLDFIKVIPPQGNLVSRVVMTPGHLKRVIEALQTNIKLYEEKYGTIKQVSAPQEGEIGFKE